MSRQSSIVHRQSSVHTVADQLLAGLAEIAGAIDEAQAEARVELEAVKAKHEKRLAVLKELFDTREKALISHMKGHRAAIFSDTDQVDLPSGILLHGSQDRVQIPRDALKTMILLGWEDGLKRTVAANREVIEKWPVERLAAIGAEKKSVEVYSYEFKEQITKARKDESTK